MQTNFAPAALADPQMASSEKIVRTCVHCGFCTATCPTYVLGGDELDSPRGRIYLIKDMLEGGKPPSEQVVKHVDRCLSCLSCMTTCPSGVNYMHLVDHARAYIEQTYQRPFLDRMVRNMLALVLPYPNVFRAAMMAGRVAKPFSGLLAKLPAGNKIKAMLDLVPSHLPSPSSLRRPQTVRANAPRQGRVAILSGCAQPVLKPSISEATARVLARHGVDVIVPKGEGCCGALVHHMGRTEASHDFAKRNIDAWTAEIEGDGLDAIVITTSGCGTTVKDYGFMFRDDVDYAAKAARVSALAKDVTEYLSTIALAAPVISTGQVVAYHSACSMQHGQQIKEQPKKLLRAMGFKVKDVPEGHICCGSAGTYNIMQPEIAGQLRDRKIANIERTKPEITATGNIGCMTQIAQGTGIPIVHTIELIDWATGGPMPSVLAGR
jgi:glycolate oxidase iron-sulfur subunit